MLQKFTNIFNSELFTVSALNGISTIIKMIAAFVSIKVVASIIGPSGIAQLGQLNNFSAIILSLSTAGINTGLTKYIAENSGSPKNYLPFIKTGFSLTLFFTTITSIILIFKSRYFAIIVLNDAGYSSIFFIFGISLIFYSLNAIILSIINGFKKFKEFVIINIIGSVLGLLLSILLTINFGIYGALISIVTFQSVVFFITLFIIKNNDWLSWNLFSLNYDKSIVLKLGKFSLMAAATAIALPLVQIVIRSYITTHYSLNAAGLWEGINRISNMYLVIITTSLSIYLLPKLATLQHRHELRIEIVNSFKLIIPFLFVASTSIFFLRTIIIDILFTNDFIEMKDLFIFQLIGDTLKISGWILGSLILAKAQVKLFIIMELLSAGLQISLSIFFIKEFGTIGATIGYAAGHFIYFIILLIYFKKLLFPNYKFNK